jgi:hypothetical protein
MSTFHRIGKKVVQLVSYLVGALDLSNAITQTTVKANFTIKQHSSATNQQKLRVTIKHHSFITKDQVADAHGWSRSRVARRTGHLTHCRAEILLKTGWW